MQRNSGDDVGAAQWILEVLGKLGTGWAYTAISLAGFAGTGGAWGVAMNITKNKWIASIAAVLVGLILLTIFYPTTEAIERIRCSGIDGHGVCINRD